MIDFAVDSCIVIIAFDTALCEFFSSNSIFSHQQTMTKHGWSVTLQLLAEFINVGTLSVQAEDTVASKNVINMTLDSDNLDSKSVSACNL